MRAGTTVVATDGILAAGDRLADAARELERMRHRLGGLRAEVRSVALGASSMSAPTAPLAMWSVARTESTIDESTDVLAGAEREAERLRIALARAVDNYSRADRVFRLLHQGLAAEAAIAIGGLVRMLAPALLLGAAHAALALVIGWKLAPASDEQKTAAIGRWFEENPEVITSPEFAQVLRHIAADGDEFAGGVAGVPASLLRLLGERGLGILGVESSAVGIMTLGGVAGAFRETPVALERRSTSTGGAAPVGVRARLDRVPGGDQVRIERYSSPGRAARYAVYVGPTETFSPFAVDEPWDLTSNVAAVAGGDAGSLRAVELAMHDAGITATDEVQVIGFSQGGLIATRVAESPAWNVVGLETHGAPVGGIPLDGAIAGMEVHHSEDFVAALGGHPVPDERLHIERQAFGDEVPTGQVAPAHQRTSYEATADLIDGAQSRTVRDQVAAMDDFARGYENVTELTYRGIRVDDGADRMLADAGPAAGGGVPRATSVTR